MSNFFFQSFDRVYGYRIFKAEEYWLKNTTNLRGSRKRVGQHLLIPALIAYHGSSQRKDEMHIVQMSQFMEYRLFPLPKQHIGLGEAYWWIFSTAQMSGSLFVISKGGSSHVTGTAQFWWSLYHRRVILEFLPVNDQSVQIIRRCLSYDTGYWLIPTSKVSLICLGTDYMLDAEVLS